jgi:hypothetical protein
MTQRQKPSDQRRERLAAELRANLKRRKARTAGRDGQAPTESDKDPRPGDAGASRSPSRDEA